MKLKQLTICCSPAVAKDGFVFWNCTGRRIRNLIPTLGIIWKFHVNIAYAQVNPLCSCQSSIAVLIVGRRKLALLQSGMAFSVSSTFIFIIYIIFVPISPIFSYFRMMFVLLTFSLFYSFTLVFTTGLALISQGKWGSPFIKVTLTELSISNLRHTFTLK